MKAILQTRQPVKTPNGGNHDLIGGDFIIDDENAVANTAFGVFVIRRADILCALIVSDEADLSNEQNVMMLN